MYTLPFRQKSFLLSISFFALFSFTSCNKGKLDLVNKNFDEEIALRQNLIFNFNQDLVSDSLLNDWDSTVYIQFEPAVKGKFKWTANDELTFSPDYGFQPATDYKATLTSELLQKTSEKLSFGDGKELSFHTPYLNVEKVTAYWTKSQNGTPEVRYQLAFNYKVNPSEVANLTSLKVNGETINAKTTSTQLSENVTLAIDGKDNFQSQASEIIIKDGLKTENGKASKIEIKTEADIPDKDPLKITGIETEYEGEVGVTYVYTNQTVNTADLKSYISIDPATDFDVEAQDFGFVIKSAQFKPGSYSLTFSNQLRGVFGSKLEEDHTRVIAFGEMRPSIQFASEKGFYLTSKGSKNVGVKIIGLEKVKVSIYKIYENNILPFTRQGGYIDDYSYYNEETGEYQNNSDNAFGDVVSEKIINVKDLRKEAGVYYLNMNLREINDLKGMYAVKVSSTDENWVQASKMLSISDIGLIVKETENEIYVFANSIMTAEPVAGLKVDLVSSNNQIVYTVETDGKGIATFPDIKKKAPKFKIAMISAKHKDDFNFILFSENRVETSRYEVGGIRENASGYQAFIYGDRDIYRPGETMYLNTVIRDGRWKIIGEMPVKVKVIAPNGKEFSTLKGILNKQSAFATSITFPASTITGTYNVEVYSANDILLVSKTVSVEEFMPDRIKVNVNLAKKDYRNGENVTIIATALNLFGPPAANRNYELTFSLSRDNISSKDFSDYNFLISGNETVNFEQVVRQGTTDGQGGIKESFQLPNYQDIGVLSGKIYTTVFDESGRAVHRLSPFSVITQDVFYGIKYFDSYTGTGEKLEIPIIAVNKDGKALSGVSANIQVIKTNYETVLQKDSYGNLQYLSQKKQFIMDERTISLNASATIYSYIPQQSGEYEVRVMRPGSKSFVVQNFYAYGFGTSNTSFEVNKEGQISIEPDKKKYKVGENATILLKTPFAGKVLVTVERNKVFEKYYIETDKKSASIDIPIKEEYLPNVYITATLIKPLSEGAIPLTVAHGFAPITVEDEDYQLPIEITAVPQSRSKIKQTILVKTKPNAEVTLAIVDEGILQLKNYQTPNPYNYFFQKRALEVNGYDLYPRLFPEMTKKSTTGGDAVMSSALAGRTNPLTNKRVTLVSFWSGTLTANSNGEASYVVDIPQFSGDLRIMAVAYKENAFGSTSKNMKVADPIVIASSLPRFLSPGDNILVPVTLSNTTKQMAQAKAVLKLTGGLTVAGNASQLISIPANSESQVVFSVNASQAVGYGSVEIVVNALNSTFTDKTELTIRPIQSLLKTSGSGIVAAGKGTNFTLAGNFIPASTQAKLVISKSPVAQFAGNLDDLLQYPYGCVEQTTSSAFPQIYFASLSQSLSKKPGIKALSPAEKSGLANYNVQQAINKLSSMQLSNGALSYWPEGGNESWWGTAYAAHFMIEARKAGFEVNRQVLNKILDYLRSQARNKKNQEEYFFYDQNSIRRTKKIAPKEIAYSLYVLALGSKADVSTMNYYKSRKELLAIDSKYLLGAAYLLMGDNGSYRSVIPSTFAGEKSESVFGGSFYSYIRDEGIALNSLLDTDPQNVQIPMMSKHLSEQMKKSRWLSTQEMAFGLLAFGKIAKQTNKTQVSAQISADGKNIASFKDEDLVIASGIANKAVNIQTSGAGSLYYFWQAQGLSTSSDVKEEDNYLKVRKTFYDRFGRQLSGNTFYQNDLVVVKVDVSTTDGSSVENVVLTDMLPAGFEIENPRIADMPEMAWASKNAYTPEHMDIRDDRISLFTTATGQVQSFYFVVRAVSKGTFRMGPVSADAMYNGEYHSINGSGTIRILDRNGNEPIEEATEQQVDSVGLGK